MKTIIIHTAGWDAKWNKGPSKKENTQNYEIFRREKNILRNISNILEPYYYYILDVCVYVCVIYASVICHWLEHNFVLVGWLVDGPLLLLLFMVISIIMTILPVLTI